MSSIRGLRLLAFRHHHHLPRSSHFPPALRQRRCFASCDVHLAPAVGIIRQQARLRHDGSPPSAKSITAASVMLSSYSGFGLPPSLELGNVSGLPLSMRSRQRCLSSAVDADDAKDDGNSGPLGGYDLDADECNVPPTIASRVGTANLHRTDLHPLNTIKTIIERYWRNRGNFAIFDDLNPVVSTEANFDSLLIEPDHVSRSKSDTYYVDGDTVLRTHTSAHQVELLRDGHDEFLVTGDVYRRDEIDSSHYPIFHQMEGVKLFTEDELSSATTPEERTKLVEADLKTGLEGMARELFGDVEMRWVDTYFPFTEPSFELEIFFGGEWLEVLGCGVMRQEIIRNSRRERVGGNNGVGHRGGVDGDDGPPGWAFGLGLERLAMVLFSIPDIRLFWSTDERFHSQFSNGQIVTFVPYSKYPPCYKDISFWISDGRNEEDGSAPFHPNDFNEGVRDVAGDLVEKVELIDTFVHPKSKKTSNCFRITYRSMDRSLTNEEVDRLQERVREYTVERLGVDLR